MINGRNLAAGDDSGKSDPFAVVYIGKSKKFKTKEKKGTLDPDWNHKAEVSGINYPPQVSKQNHH